MDDLTIRPLQGRDIPGIVAAVAALGWHEPAAQYERYLAEQERGERVVLVALVAGTFVGYLTIVWRSSYDPFQADGIPEIVDFNVLPGQRRRGTGTRLMAEAERHVAERSPVIGIGVGMDGDYGAAQRLYVKRGYIPDGRGLTSHGRHVTWGQTVTVDDALVLYFTRELRS